MMIRLTAYAGIGRMLSSDLFVFYVFESGIEPLFNVRGIHS